MKEILWLKKNADIFWESVSNYWLFPLLTKSYRDEKKSAKIRRWIKDGKKIIKIEITDFYMDPFFIILHPEGFELTVEEGGEPDVIVRTKKVRLIIDGTSFISLLVSYLLGETEIKFSRVKFYDIFMFFRLFYKWK